MMHLKTLAVIVLLGISFSSLAKEEEESQKQGNQVVSKDMGDVAKFCAAKISFEGKTAAEQEKLKRDIEYRECMGLSHHGGLRDSREFQATPRGEIQCQKKGGFTIDYQYCAAAIQAYTYVAVAEKALMLQQQVVTDLKQQSIQRDVSRKMTLGDGQTGMFDASIADNNHKKSMMQQQAVAYSAAVTALGRTYFAWPSEENLMGKCAEGKSEEEKNQCNLALKKYQNQIIANSAQKVGLVAIITEYIAKGAAAGVAMGNFNAAAQQMEQVKQATSSDGTDEVIMERCMINPTDPLCSKSGSRISPGSYQQGNLSFGDGSGNNSFNMDEGTSDFGIDGEPETVVDGPSVKSADSPFEEIAKEANGILDPAAAASMQPGQGAAGGGGGAGGGMGGGGASLGNDLAGAENEDNKEANIKASKASGNYNFAGGGGFAALKKGKEDSNPFASMFDNKGAGGGIEEDRSIASGDIDGQASGLFQKISRRYGRIHADKRIEAKNLE